MLTISGNPKILCLESIVCYYKADDTCTFLEKVKDLLIDHYEEYHKELNSSINITETYELPCKLLDEDDRQRGIGNLFADLGYGK